MRRIDKAVKKAECRDGHVIFLVPWGLHYKWVGTDGAWKCHPTEQFPVRSHAPKRGTARYTDAPKQSDCKACATGRGRHSCGLSRLQDMLRIGSRIGRRR